jgi:hypothetical protein
LHSLLLFHYFLFLCSSSSFFLTFQLSFFLSCYLFKFSFALLASNFSFYLLSEIRGKKSLKSRNESHMHCLFLYVIPTVANLLYYIRHILYCLLNCTCISLLTYLRS